MAIYEFLSYIVVGIEFVTTAVIALMFYCWYPPPIYYWDKMCDNCSKSTAKYCYVFRFVFGKYKTNFDLNKATITLEVLDADKPMVTLQIPPRLLVSHIPNCPNLGFNTVRFLLYRKEPLLNIVNIVLNHNTTGTINVSQIEIQDLNSAEANIGYVGQAIASLTKEKAKMTQLFASATKQKREIEADLKPRLTLTGLEYLVFTFLALNLQLLLPIYVIPCPSMTFCTDYSDGMLSSVFAGLASGSIAAFVFILSLVIHRYVIKKSIFEGIGFCSFFKYSALLSAILLGILFGILSALMGGHNRKFPRVNQKQEFVHEVYWSIAAAISVFVFLVLFVSIFAVIAYLIGFCSEPSAKPSLEPKEVYDATTRTDLESEEQSSDYYHGLITNKDTKVKSISQYTGLSKGQQKSTPPSAPGPTPSMKKASTSKRGSVQKSDSEESVGEGYYKQLMKAHGKVKSVSQYKGPTK